MMRKNDIPWIKGTERPEIFKAVVLSQVTIE